MHVSRISRVSSSLLFLALAACKSNAERAAEARAQLEARTAASAEAAEAAEAAEGVRRNDIVRQREEYVAQLDQGRVALQVLAESTVTASRHGGAQAAVTAFADQREQASARVAVARRARTALFDGDAGALPDPGTRILEEQAASTALTDAASELRARICSLSSKDPTSLTAAARATAYRGVCDEFTGLVAGL